MCLLTYAFVYLFSLVGGRPIDEQFHCRETKTVFAIIKFCLYVMYIRYCVRAAPKFGKHPSLFSFHKEQKYM